MTVQGLPTEAEINSFWEQIVEDGRETSREMATKLIHEATARGLTFEITLEGDLKVTGPFGARCEFQRRVASDEHYIKEVLRRTRKPTLVK